MIRLERITKRYGEVLAVREVDLEVQAGELVVLIGPSGCGKTTTLKMINRLIEPSEGAIYVNGEDTQTLDPQRVAARHRLRDSEHRAFPAHERQAKHPGGAGPPGLAQKAGARRGRTSSLASSACLPSATATPTRASSRAARRSGWGWRARSRWTRPCC